MVSQHGLDIDDLSHQREGFFFTVMSMFHGEIDGGINRSLHPLDRILQTHTFGTITTDFYDLVVGENAGLVSRCTNQWRDDHQFSVGHTDADTDSAELVFDAGLKGIQVIGCNVIGVLIQFAQHPANRSLHQFPTADLFDIVSLNLIHGIREELDQLEILFIHHGRFFDRGLLGHIGLGPTLRRSGFSLLRKSRPSV